MAFWVAPGIKLSITNFDKTFHAEQDLLDRILAVELIDREMGKSELVVRLDNRDMRLFGRPTNELSLAYMDVFHNAIWEVQIGYPSEGLLTAPQRYRFVVKELKGFRTLTLRAFDDSQTRLDSVARYRKFIPKAGQKLRRSQIALTIALQNKLLISNNSIFKTTGEFLEIPQSGLTDAKMLTRMARTLGFVWYVIEPVENVRLFFFHPRFLRKDPKDTAVIELVNDRSVLDFRLNTSIYRVPTSFMATGLDPFKGTIERYKASNKTTERHATGDGTPIDEDVPQSSAFNGQDFARPNKDEAAKIFASGNAGLKRLKNMQEDLDGLFKQHEAFMTKATLTLVGEPVWFPRDTLRLENIGSLSGIWYIAEVRHNIKPGKPYTTTLSLMKNAFQIDQATAAQNRIKKIENDRNEAFKKKKEEEREAALQKAIRDMPPVRIQGVPFFTGTTKDHLIKGIPVQSYLPQDFGEDAETNEPALVSPAPSVTEPFSLTGINAVIPE
jgi:hypothetical protein